MRRASALLVLLVCLLGGCAREGARAPEPVRLTAMQYVPDGQNIDFDAMWFYQELEARTNVRVEFTSVKGADWDARLSLMFASGSYADMILRGELDVEAYGVTQKILVPLDDYIPTCMPNYASRLGMNGAGDTIPASDGKSYYIGHFVAEDVCVNGQFFLNRAWLNALGLEVPETVDELTAVLRAFRDGDPNGNGLRDETPYIATLDGGDTGLYTAFSFWGLPVNEAFVYLDDAKTVRFAPESEGFRECAAWLNALYKEGLLDPESLTQARALMLVKVNAGTTGFFSAYQLQNTSLLPEIASQFECALPVRAPGREAKLCRTVEAARMGAAITTANTHIEETLRWLDAQMDTETMLVAQYGRLGETLRINAEGRYEACEPPDGQAPQNLVPGACGQCFAPADFYSEVYEMAPYQAEKQEYCRLYQDAGALEANSYYALTKLAAFTPDEAARLALLRPAIENAVNRALVSMVCQGVTDEGWAAFINELRALGAGEYTAIYQNAYDRGAEASA